MVKTVQIGPQGTAGTNGQDGNANVQNITIDISDSNGTVHTEAIAELTADVLENDLVYAFVHTSTLTYPIPNALNPAGTEFFIRYFMMTGSFNMRFNLTSDNSNYDMPVGTLDELRVVIVEATSGRSAEHAQQELLNAGVDVTNYDSLKAHFDLN